jgi:hypothetical protein
MGINSSGRITRYNDANVLAFRDFIENAYSIDLDETYRMKIGYDNEDNYFLVAGYVDGFEDGAHLCVKIAKLVSNAMSEYDIDFEMPIDTETGDVWDTEISDPTPDDAQWLYNEFTAMIDESDYDDEEYY